jgi:hypothetical protein
MIFWVNNNCIQMVILKIWYIKDETLLINLMVSNGMLGKIVFKLIPMLYILKRAGVAQTNVLFFQRYGVQLVTWRIL